jgi:hypothetical protein
VPWSRKSRAIPLLPLWAVRPVQSLSVCTKVHFTFTPNNSVPNWCLIVMINCRFVVGTYVVRIPTRFLAVMKDILLSTRFEARSPYCEKRLRAASCLSVHVGRLGPPIGGFLLNFTFEYFSKIYLLFRVLSKSDKNNWYFACIPIYINPLNAELNPICPLLALFGAHLILHVSSKGLIFTSG